MSTLGFCHDWRPLTRMGAVTPPQLVDDRVAGRKRRDCADIRAPFT
jgi:hypothetical protein